MRFASIEFSSVTANEYTEWAFLTTGDGEGTTAVTEFTHSGATADVARAIRELVALLDGKDVADESRIPEMLGFTTERSRADRVAVTALSVLRTAVVDIQCQYDGVSITEGLGGSPQDSVPLYANINRSLLGKERTPSALGAAAERAARDGFAIVKCAPFDEVQPPVDASDILELARPGIQRVAAVRSAVGPDVRVLVDCHSRFEAHTAPPVAEELLKLNVGWFEEPLQPTTHAEELAVVAAEVGIPVAGGESGYGEDFFVGLVQKGAVRIVMPDIKHCGGVAEAFRAGRSTTAAGGQFSLHSPSGPISLLASAHVTAAVPGALALEHAVYEAPWRAELTIPAEHIEGGRLWFPGGEGLGARPNPEVVARYGRVWQG